MRLYHTLKPHPAAGAGREVRMFLHEKGLALATVEVDMMEGENRSAALVAKNPAGQLPFLELDDGQVIGESLAICELLDDLHPEPPLIGRTAVEKAETRMWQRRIEFGVTENIMNGWRFGEGREWWKTRGRVIPEAADGLKAIARDKLAWLDRAMDGRTFVVGPRFTLADILLLVTLDLADLLGQPLELTNANLAAWRARVTSRPSAAASLRG